MKKKERISFLGQAAHGLSVMGASLAMDVARLEGQLAIQQRATMDAEKRGCKLLIHGGRCEHLAACQKIASDYAEQAAKLGRSNNALYADNNAFAKAAADRIKELEETNKERWSMIKQLERRTKELEAQYTKPHKFTAAENWERFKQEIAPDCSNVEVWRDDGKWVAFGADATADEFLPMFEVYPGRRPCYRIVPTSTAIHIPSNNPKKG